MNRFELAKSIDQSILSTDAGIKDVSNVCNEAIEYGFATVFVLPGYIDVVIEQLHDSSVKVGSVVSFPLGNTPTEVKVYEARQYLEKGVQEIDMVMNVGALKSGQLDVVLNDINAVVNEIRKGSLYGRKSSVLIKVIIEACYLNDKEKIIAAEIVRKAGADFVKTSTGFGSYGATVEDVNLLFRTVGNELGIKASGGIRHFEQAQAMLDAGATRIGTSTGAQIIEEFIKYEKERKKKRKSGIKSKK